MSNKLRWQVIKATGIVLLMTIVAMRILDKRLNTNPLLGGIVVGVCLFSISLLAFLIGGLPFQPLGATDKTIRWAFIFACCAVAYGALQVPFWSWMSHLFPSAPSAGPSTFQAGFRDGVLISMFGPAAPLIVRMARSILKPDKEKTQDLRRRIEERREQP